MESNGLPYRIHCSAATAKLLQTFGTFQVEERGELEVKGKGKMTTFWLNGETTPEQEETGPAGYCTIPTFFVFFADFQ